MSKSPYCKEHQSRLTESGVNQFYFDTALITWIFHHHVEWFNNHDVCYLCCTPEARIVDCIKEASELEAKVKDNGGTYTTDKISVFGGGSD